MAHSTIAQPIFYIYPQFEENTWLRHLWAATRLGANQAEARNFASLQVCALQIV